MLHVGPNSQLVSKAYLNNGKPIPPDLIGGGENLRVRDFMALAFAPQMFLTALVFDGVFERLERVVLDLGRGIDLGRRGRARGRNRMPRRLLSLR